MGIFFAVTASFFCTLSNYCIRKSQDHGGTSQTAIMIQMIAAFIMMVFLNPIRMNSYFITPSVVILGLIAGGVLGTMLYFIGKALEKGPAGLTFAAISAATALPSIFLFFAVGELFQLEYHFWNGLGSLMVIAGLFWAASQYTQVKEMKKWLLFAMTAFSLHIVFLVLISVRSLAMNFPQLQVPFFPAEELQSLWFMPMIYLASALLQVHAFYKQEKRSISRWEWIYGLIGGFANGCSTFFVIKSSEYASPLERAMIFPIFSVLVMVFCYAWGQKLYQEKVNWKACNLSVLGLIIGTVDWQMIFK
ncbi:MAG TPA: hypothetical protein VLG44_05690 [Chlamydiales bacterium]|nr:hypothetical protein [Chlamydiales bacterium]